MGHHGGNEITSRRRFLVGCGSVAAMSALAGCGDARLRGIAPTAPTEPTVPGPSIGGAATVEVQARRGESFQVGPTRPSRTWRPGQFVTHVDVASRRMALTFDDGPSPYNTESILRTLDSFGVKATFYLVGVNVRSWPAIARRTAEAGHELGNHSVYHTPYSAAPLASQIGANQDIIASAAGVRPVTHRAPGLTKGQVILDTCAAYDLYETHTHMATYDWISPRHSAYELYLEFVRYHRNGAFALYHDGGGRRPTPTALPDIVRYGQSVGYEFVTATELMMSGRPQPVSADGGYASSTSGELRVDGALADGSSVDAAADSYVDRCNYDAEAELRAMLDGDLSLTYADRMRIVGALADLEAVKNES